MPSIVECDIQVAKFLNGLLDQRLHLGGDRYIGFYEEALAAGSAYSDSTVSFPSASRRPATTTLAPALAKRMAAVASDTGGAAGHEHNFALQVRCHSLPGE